MSWSALFEGQGALFCRSLSRKCSEAIAKYAVDTSLFQLGSTNPRKKYHVPGYFFFQKCSNIWIKKIPIYFFQIYMNDTESAEAKEKANFRFLRLLFFELWSFLYSNHPNFRWIFTIANSKSKNRKIEFSFVSAYWASSIKTGSKLRGKRGLHILRWEKSVIAQDTCSNR